MLELHRMANGWLVTPPPNRAMDYPRENERCFVFTSWDELVAHLKKELKLSGPEQSQGDEDCKSSS